MLPERVHVIPLGVDPKVFCPAWTPCRCRPARMCDSCSLAGRSSAKGSISFSRAFQPADDVGLVIKDMGSKSFYRGQTAEANVAGLRQRGCPVEYIDRTLSETELARLYAACDCLVHPFRGEGFALPVVEAMACGLPVIVTGAGPALDYATNETAYLIPAHRGQFAECRVGGLVTIGRSWLYEPDLDALVELLKRVASDRAGARAKGTAASVWIRSHFTWANTAEAAERRLVALAGENQNQPRISGSVSSSRTVRISLTMFVDTLSFSQGRLERHRQSRSDKETAFDRCKDMGPVGSNSPRDRALSAFRRPRSSRPRRGS